MQETQPNHPSLKFNNTVVIQSANHKHLGMIFDTKLDFQEYLKDKLSRISKTITEATRRTSKEKLYQELGLKSLEKRR